MVNKISGLCGSYSRPGLSCLHQPKHALKSNLTALQSFANGIGISDQSLKKFLLCIFGQELDFMFTGPKIRSEDDFENSVLFAFHRGARVSIFPDGLLMFGYSKFCMINFQSLVIDCTFDTEAPLHGTGEPKTSYRLTADVVKDKISKYQFHQNDLLRQLLNFTFKIVRPADAESRFINFDTKLLDVIHSQLIEKFDETQFYKTVNVQAVDAFYSDVCNSAPGKYTLSSNDQSLSLSFFFPEAYRFRARALSGTLFLRITFEQNNNESLKFEFLFHCYY